MFYRKIHHFLKFIRNTSDWLVLHILFGDDIGDVISRFFAVMACFSNTCFEWKHFILVAATFTFLDKAVSFLCRFWLFLLSFPVFFLKFEMRGFQKQWGHFYVIWLHHRMSRVLKETIFGRTMNPPSFINCHGFIAIRVTGGGPQRSSNALWFRRQKTAVLNKFQGAQNGKCLSHALMPLNTGRLAITIFTPMFHNPALQISIFLICLYAGDYC